MLVGRRRQLRCASAVWWAAGARTDAGKIRRSRCTYAGAVGSAATKFTRVVAPTHAVPLEKLCLQIDPWHWPSVSFASRQLCLDSESSSVSGCRNTGANVPNLVRNLASQSKTSRIVVFLRKKNPNYTIKLSQKSDFQHLTIKPDNMGPNYQNQTNLDIKVISKVLLYL